jgi:hypothetical protein
MEKAHSHPFSKPTEDIGRTTTNTDRATTKINPIMSSMKENMSMTSPMELDTSSNGTMSIKATSIMAFHMDRAMKSMIGTSKRATKKA